MGEVRLYYVLPWGNGVESRVNIRYQGGLWFAVASHICEGCNKTKTARGFFNQE